ncbi:MAG: hypothetical protein ACR2LM_04085 [Pyrinomonadaceae bacterium]
MLSVNWRSMLIAATAAIVFSLSGSAAEAKTKKKVLPRGVPVLWTAPVNIDSRNLYLGPGGAAMQPNLLSVTFLEEEKGGYSGTK